MMTTETFLMTKLLRELKQMNDFLAVEQTRGLALMKATPLQRMMWPVFCNQLFKS
ncbi:hypothetical protein DPMN_089667 [Dreissena polymorpha]|uniref:Uncharacterized protein n=1 Tax=Dreissena polymorpha TaxID=45954 RepID=A0A9D4KYB1_DREPO|nr:hypothetical protein DPMN_089667 [Dreissena polymorpha]